LSIFDEPETRRSKVSQARSRVRTARRPWPLSARLLVGALFVLNILLVAFVARNEIKRPGAPATSTPLTLEGPKAQPSPVVTAPIDRGSSLDLKTLPVEAMPAALPSTQMAKRPANKAPRAGRTLLPHVSAPMPQAWVHPPQGRLGQNGAFVRVPAASPSSIANVAPPGAGVLANAGSPPNAPAPSVPSPPAISHGLTAKGTRPASMNRVASVGLPSPEKGLVIPKRPVAPISPKLEIVPRPAGKIENCGDDQAFIACPTLQTRPETPISSEDP
jgi:hypothetical protein